MAVAVHHGRDLWNFAREDTDPIHVPRPEGPWGPWALHGAQCQQCQPVQNTPLQAAAVQAAAAPKPTIQTTVQSPTTQEAAPIVLWERPPKPAGWSAIWEVLPPPPPPPFGQDGVWIWVPEGEEAPVGGMVPHEGAFLPCADIDDEELAEASYAASQSPSQGFASASMQAAFAEMPPGPAPSGPARSDYSSGGTSAGGQEKTQIAQIPPAVPPVSRQGEFPSNFTDGFHSQASYAAGMSGMRGFADAKDAFAASAATPRGNEDASSMKSPSVQSNPSNPYLSLPGVVQASMRDSPPASQAQVPQVWNPFPTETIAADPPVEQAWNPWASMGEVDGPFGRSLQETQRMIVGDIGAFNSDDWRSRSALPSMQSVPAPSSNSLQATAFPAGATAAAGLPSMPSMPFGSGYGAQLSPIGMEDFHSLESTSFWKVQPAAAPVQNGSVQVPTPRPNSDRVNRVMPQVPQVGISSQGSIPPGRKSIPSAGSGSQGFLTSTSDGLEVTYPMNQVAPLSSQRLSQNARPLPNPTEVPGAAHLASPNAQSPTPWPLASAGLRPTPQVQLLDVTGAGSCLRNNMDIPGRPDYDVLGPMYPCSVTWMNDPRLAQMPVAQIAERNRHAAPVLLDVTSGGQAFHPDD